MSTKAHALISGSCPEFAIRIVEELERDLASSKATLAKIDCAMDGKSIYEWKTLLEAEKHQSHANAQAADNWRIEAENAQSREQASREAAIASERRLSPLRQALLEILHDYEKHGQSDSNYSDGEFTQDYTTRLERVKSALNL